MQRERGEINNTPCKTTKTFENQIKPIKTNQSTYSNCDLNVLIFFESDCNYSQRIVHTWFFVQSGVFGDGIAKVRIGRTELDDGQFWLQIERKHERMKADGKQQ